jgi:hypothetical protein
MLGRIISIVLISAFLPSHGDTGYQSGNQIQELALKVAGAKGPSKVRTQRLVHWMYENFEFTFTDYKKRTVEEIIKRRGGNCAEQARVLWALLESIDINARWVSEINIQPKNRRRQTDAEELVREMGISASVFGLMHNDHRWLEVYDDRSETWIPADPTLDILGVRAWIEARVGFSERPEAVKDMIVPFVVVVKEKRKVLENRSQYYLIDEFNAFYNQRLESLNSWPEWIAVINELSKLGISAFAGEINLHKHTDLMERFSKVYAKIKNEYIASVSH